MTRLFLRKNRIPTLLLSLIAVIYYISIKSIDARIHGSQSVNNTTSLTTTPNHRRLPSHNPRYPVEGYTLPHFPNIIGGHDAPVGRYPYLVSVLTKRRGSSIQYHFCGASLIAPNVVLCAAHCIYKDEATAVQIGKHELGNNREDVETFDIAEYRVCPKWDKRTYNCDVALLKLSGNSHKHPVKLLTNKDDVRVGDQLTVMGWGVTEMGGEKSETLQHTVVKLHDHAKCDAKYYGLVTDMMICAWERDTDACQGDSGGPLIVKGTRSAEDVQVGVVSFGYGCATANPGVYADVANGEIQSFIEEVKCEYAPESCKEEDRETSPPTVAPVTSAPTISPVTSTPTVSPVSSAPTVSPVSSTPTVSPVSSGPTVSPMPSAPVVSPVAISPSSSPTMSPVTNSPSLSPTMSPVTDSPSSPPTGLVGDEDDYGRYPYMVAIYVRKTNEFIHYCNGAIIETNLILLAAHCILDGKDMNVYAITGDGSWKMYPVQSFKRCRHWNRQTYNCDVAVAKVDGMSDQRALVSLHDDFDLLEGETLVEMGMDVSSTDLSTAFVEQEVTMNRNYYCNRKFFFFFKNRYNFCAYADGSCPPITGGPIIRKGSNHDKDTIVGLSSFGSGCNQHSPGVHVGVAKHGIKKFIKGAICDYVPEKCV